MVIRRWVAFHPGARDPHVTKVCTRRFALEARSLAVHINAGLRAKELAKLELPTTYPITDRSLLTTIIAPRGVKLPARVSPPRGRVYLGLHSPLRHAELQAKPR